MSTSKIIVVASRLVLKLGPHRDLTRLYKSCLFLAKWVSNINVALACSASSHLSQEHSLFYINVVKGINVSDNILFTKDLLLSWKRCVFLTFQIVVVASRMFITSVADTISPNYDASTSQTAAPDQSL